MNRKIPQLSRQKLLKSPENPPLHPWMKKVKKYKRKPKKQSKQKLDQLEKIQQIKRRKKYNPPNNPVKNKPQRNLLNPLLPRLNLHQDHHSKSQLLLKRKLLNNPALKAPNRLLKPLKRLFLPRPPLKLKRSSLANKVKNKSSQPKKLFKRKKSSAHLRNLKNKNLLRRQLLNLLYKRLNHPFKRLNLQLLSQWPRRLLNKKVNQNKAKKKLNLRLKLKPRRFQNPLNQNLKNNKNPFQFEKFLTMLKLPKNNNQNKMMNKDNFKFVFKVLLLLLMTVIFVNYSNHVDRFLTLIY